MAQRQESKDSAIESREDAGNSDEARRRRNARTDSPDKSAFSIRKDGPGFGLGKVEVGPDARTDMGVKTGLGMYTKPGEPDSDLNDADAARARRIARTTR